MTALDALRAALEAAVRELPDEDLPAALGTVAAADARLKRRHLQAAAVPAALRWISAEAAQAIAEMPRRRLFAIAKRPDAQGWALMVGRKLLVETGGFMRWLTDHGRMPKPTIQSARNGARHHKKPRRRDAHGRFVPRVRPRALAADAKVAS